MTKAVHLSSAHSAFDDRIFEKECRTLAAAGYEVVFVVPHAQDELRDGVRIRAVTVPKSRLERFTRTVWEVYRAALSENGDIYHFHDPDLMPIGILLKIHGKRVIYDVHETYRKTMLSSQWLPMQLQLCASWGVAFLEGITGMICDQIIPANPGTAAYFPANKTVVVCNFPEADFAKGACAPGKDIAEEKKRGRIVYAGGISLARGIETMIDAIANIPEYLSPELVVAGSITSKLRERLSAKPGWKRVTAAGWQSRSEVSALLRSSEVGLCVLHSTPNHLVSYPVKLFEYMSCGLPAVVSDFPMWREVVESSECGILVDPKQTDKVADAIIWLLEHPGEAEQMGRNGLRAVKDRYNWESEGARLLASYSGIVRKEATANA